MTQYQCPVCFDEFSIKDMIIICWNEHKLCDTCYKGCCDSNRSLKCPLDRQQMFDFRIIQAPQPVVREQPQVTDWKIPDTLVDRRCLHLYGYLEDYNAILLIPLHEQLFNSRGYFEPYVENVILHQYRENGETREEKEARLYDRLCNLRDYLYLNHKDSPYNERRRNCSLCRCMGHNKNECDGWWRYWLTNEEDFFGTTGTPQERIEALMPHITAQEKATIETMNQRWRR